jgi:large subunit ribosomal protein L2
LIKSAGSYATIVGRDEATNLVFLKLSSGEVRKFNHQCWATIGEVGNDQHQNVVIGKAGRQRWL